MKFHDIFEAQYHVHPIVNALRKHFDDNRVINHTEFNSTHLESALQALRDELGLEINHIDDDYHGLDLIEWSWDKNNFHILLKVIPPTVKEIEDKNEKVLLIVTQEEN